MLASLARLVVVVAVVAGVAMGARAEPAEFNHVVRPVSLDSGDRDNPEKAERVVFSQEVSLDGAPWLRLVFDEARLGTGSYVRITGSLDGEVQFLDAKSMLEWQRTSAYFNGSSMLVELIAGANTTGNRIKLTRVLAGAADQPGTPEMRVCSGPDNRAPSSDPRACRLLSIVLPVPNCGPGFPCANVTGGVCTGSITNRPVAGDPTNRVLLSAGHCFDLGATSLACTVAQFDVPRSVESTCQFRHPPVAKQFVIDPFRTRFQATGPGGDWAAFVCFANPVTGLTCYEEQGQSFTLGSAPSAGMTLTKFGYGAQGSSGGTDPFCVCTPDSQLAALHCTQQTSTGIARAVSGSLICHDVRDCSGDSGEPLIGPAGTLVGIGTHGTCPGSSPSSIPGCPSGLPSPRNAGTAVTNPSLQAALSLLASGGGAPQNDACASALTVTDGTIYFSTIGATTDGNPDVRCNSSGDSNVQRDVWFRYTAAVSGVTIFSLCGSTFDTRLAIYSGSCVPGANTALACNDDNNICGNGSLQSDIELHTTAGATYLIRVGGFGGATGLGALTIIPPALRPINDNCAGALILPEGTWEFSTLGATTDSPPTCDIWNEIWFGFVADANGIVEVSTCIGTGYDTVLTAYAAGMSGICPPGPQLACNDDACWMQSRITFPVVSGNVYLVAVGGYAGDTGTGFITRSPIIPGRGPSNNRCEFAAPAVDGDNPFNTIGATTDGPADCPAHSDVWFRYVATATGLTEASTCSSLYDTVISVYAGDCPELGEALACNDDICGLNGTQAGVLFQAGAGREYLIRIGGFGGLSGPGVLSIYPPPKGPALNDNCEFAVPIVDGETPFNTTGCNTDGPGDCGVTRDAWFWYAPAHSALTRFSLCDSSYDTFIGVYDSFACPPAILLGCNDDSDACGEDSLRSRLEIPLFAGRTYTVRVGGYGNHAGEGVLEVEQVRASCACDMNRDGDTSSQDFFDFLTAFFAGSPIADINDNAVVNSQDFFEFLECFFSGC